MDLSILSQRDKIMDIIVERLGRAPLDFSEKMSLIETGKKGNSVWLAAGVLVLLSFKDELAFQLIKRASGVPQPGDISCPGGVLSTSLDHLLRPLIAHRVSQILRGNALKYARKRGRSAFKNITLFLTNALRESWEELRLNPFRVMFLGPLPCRDLITSRKTIFPLAGYVKNDRHFRPNREVERTLEIPLKAFFEDVNYGLCFVEVSGELRQKLELSRDFPCFIYQDEILWGATFSIIMNFLKIVFDYNLPESHSKRSVKKILSSDYLTGRRKSS